MKKLFSPVAIIAVLIGAGLVWNALRANAVTLQAQPTNTPASPWNVQSLVDRLPASLAGPEKPQPGQAGPPVLEQPDRGNAHVQQELQRAQALRQAGQRIPITRASGASAAGLAAPQPAIGTTQCVTALLNSTMDVVELGGGTGTVDAWAILAQKIYYDNRPGYYRSPNYSLVMVDDPAADTVIISSTLDYDAFGQGFASPSSLTAITVTYSRLYSDTNPIDAAYGNLWTLDSQGYLDQLVTWWPIGESPTGWSDRYTVVADSDTLAALAGKSLALVFDMYSDRAAPYEIIWLDDAQVTMCYPIGANKVYLPVTLKSLPPVPACVPLEPDSVNQRGSTEVGLICYGSFGAADTRDYYSLNLKGITNVRLQLTNLPTGTNWDALIYEIAGGGSYPLACQIGTPGSGNKSADCPTLSLGKNYLVLVNAGTPPTGGANTYQMSVVSRAGPTPTRTPTRTPTPPPGWVTIRNENFEGSFPGTWQVASNGGYSWGKRNCRPYAGSYSGWAVGGGASGAGLACASNYPLNVDTWMVYGPFSLAGATAGDLKFKLWLNSELNYDGVCWYASIDGNNFSGYCTTGNSAGWIDRVLDLAAVPTLGNLLGRANVWIALRFISDSISIVYPEGAYVDNLVLRKCTSASCPAAGDLVPGPGHSQMTETLAQWRLPSAH